LKHENPVTPGFMLFILIDPGSRAVGIEVPLAGASADIFPGGRGFLLSAVLTDKFAPWSWLWLPGVHYWSPAHHSLLLFISPQIRYMIPTTKATIAHIVRLGPT